jgi:hypothetical protein
MATPEEIRLQKELNDLQQENIRLKRQDMDISFSILESLKETLGINTRNTEGDKALLKVNKDINKAIQDRSQSYLTSRSIGKEILKNEGLIAKSLDFQKGLAKSINVNKENGVKETLKEIQSQKALVKEYDDLVDSIQAGNQVDEKALELKKQQIGNQDALVDLLFEGLSGLERQFVLNKENRDVLKESTDQLAKQKDQLGAASDILEVLQAIPGLGGVASRAMAEISDEIKSGKEELNGTSAILGALSGKVFEILTNPFTILSAIVGTIVKSFLEINKVQTDFRRETGLAVNQFDALNASLTTTADYIRTVNELTKQFGFNAQFAFDQVNIKAAAELVELTGLSAEEAGQLALFSQTTGTSLEDNLDTLITQTGQINIANKSAVTQRQIFRDVGNVSKAIALTFQGNTSELGKAAQQARILGLNLSQVDKIASGLLDIESSIAAEFEAEVISGRELNLERARFYALTNDLDGVTRELANNQEALKGFVNGTRLEQESIAGALQMSRDEMAEMIFQQRAQLGITDEQARKTAGLTQADFERLTVQESITKSLTKLGDIAATFIEPVLAGIANNIGLISVGLAAFGAIKLVGLISSLAKTVSLLGIMAGLTNPAGAILGITAGIAAIGIGMAAVDSFSAKASQNVGDLEFSPGDSRPRISLQEGGLRKTYVGTTNDEVNMAPGAVSGRNTGGVAFTKEDMRNAIREGIAMATLRVSPNELSNKTQVSNVINQRQYSI